MTSKKRELRTEKKSDRGSWYSLKFGKQEKQRERNGGGEEEQEREREREEMIWE